MEAGSDKRESGRGSKRFQAKGKYGARGPSEMRHVSDERPLKFEISPSDFPELGHEATSSPQEPLTYHKSPTVSPHATTSSSVSKFKAAIKEPVKKQCDVKELHPEVREEEGQRLTTWAKVASLPPKKTCLVATSTTALESTNQTSEGTKAVLNKRKKRKKKKTPQLKTADNGLDEEMFVPAEPPKIEDEKEFPGLVLSPVSQMKQSQVQGNRSKEVMEYRLASTDPTAQPSGEKINRKQPVPIKPKGQEELKGEKSTGRKSKVPIQLDLGNMLAALALKQQSNKGNTEQKPVSLTVGGAMPVAHKDSHPKKPSWVQDKIAHNPLDSTSPLVKKGKQREVPKAKKPTPLKRVILKEREERKQKRLLEEQGIPTLPLEPQSACSEAEEHLSDQNDDSAGDLGSLIMDVAEDSLQERPAVENSIPPPPKIHSRKFRDYCNQVLSKEVDECVTSLLKELVRFQDRLYQKDPRKARMKRRLVLGMREVLKHLRLHKVKCVVISPNCERSQSKGGLDEALHTIIATCREQDIPFVFALSRKALGRCISKAVPVSVVGIFNYDGAQDLYHQMIELSSEARKTYEVMVKNLEESSQEDQSELIEAAFLDEYAVRELETLSVRDTAQVL